MSATSSTKSRHYDCAVSSTIRDVYTVSCVVPSFVYIIAVVRLPPTRHQPLLLILHAWNWLLLIPNRSALPSCRFATPASMIARNCSSTSGLLPSQAQARDRGRASQSVTRKWRRICRAFGAQLQKRVPQQGASPKVRPKIWQKSQNRPDLHSRITYFGRLTKSLA